jgi:outer membrane protein OmpA-like peptidoglycan-associated protein
MILNSHKSRNVITLLTNCVTLAGIIECTFVRYNIFTIKNSKMNIRLFFIAMILTSFSWQVSAQHDITLVDRKNDPNSQNEISRKEIKAGDKTFNLKGLALTQALEHYLRAYKFEPEDPLLNFKIGVCYLYSIKKVSSIPYLEKAYKINPNINRDIHFLLGLAYQFNSEWDKAISEFEKHQLSVGQDLNKAMSGVTAKHIEECATGKRLMRHPVPVTIENLGPVVNSIFPEFAPFITADESRIFFTARKDITTGNEIDENDYQYFEDIYMAEKENGIWGIPVNLGYPVNTKNHEGTGGLSVDGQRLFVYKGDIRGGDLFESKLNGSAWTRPVSLGKKINTRYHEPSACLSPDQKTLYFVSNRPDLSYGGHDIFMSHLDKKGNWGPAENLGTAVNTPYDEDGVYMHPDGKTLIFSSKGHETMGGYDIFWSKYNNNTYTWSKPENIGYPINTPDDDLFLALSANGKHGYYASVKNDGCGEKDLYMITFLGKVKEIPDSMKYVIDINPLTLLKGRVLDAVTRIPIMASIEVVEIVNPSEISTLQSNSKSGKFLLTLPSGKNYGIFVSAPGYLFHSENFNIPESKEYQEVEIEILLDKIDVGKEIVLSNIFYDFDKATLRPESTYELQKLVTLMLDYPTIKIGIASYADSVGTEAYNQVLSTARAKSVVDWLVIHEINVNRLVYEGFGETDPTVSNDTDEGRQLNRRTEFKILSK